MAVSLLVDPQKTVLQIHDTERVINALKESMVKNFQHISDGKRTLIIATSRFPLRHVFSLRAAREVIKLTPWISAHQRIMKMKDPRGILPVKIKLLAELEILEP